MPPAGFPHSAISGSMRVCRSPELIAAYHGLHRLCVPRHPPHTFARLTTHHEDMMTKQHLHIRAIYSSSDCTRRTSVAAGSRCTSRLVTDSPPIAAALRQPDEPNPTITATFRCQTAVKHTARPRSKAVSQEKNQERERRNVSRRATTKKSFRVRARRILLAAPVRR